MEKQTKMVNIKNFPEELHNKMKGIAAFKGVTVTQAYIEAAEAYIKKSIKEIK